MENCFALGIPLILENIFKNLQVTELSVCRRVSRKWSQVATPIFVKRVDKIEIIFDCVETIAKYCSYITANISIRYANFTFNVEGHEMLEEIVQDFFCKCGEDVATLKLRLRQSRIQYIDKFDQSSNDSYEEIGRYSDIAARCLRLEEIPETIGRILFENCRNLVNLVIASLSIEFRYYSLLKESERKSLPIIGLERVEINQHYSPIGGHFVMELLQSCPHLKTVISPCSSEASSEGCFRKEETFVKCFLSAGRFDKLENISLGYVNNEVMKALEKNKGRFRLKCLKLNHFYPVDSEDALIAFLEAQAPTLKVLYIWFQTEKFVGNCDIVKPIAFPVLQTLKTLVIGIEGNAFQTNIQESLEIQFVPIDARNQFPYLEKLLIPELNCCSGTNFDDSFIHVPKNVKIIQLPSKINRHLNCLFVSSSGNGLERM